MKSLKKGKIPTEPKISTYNTTTPTVSGSYAIFQTGGKQYQGIPGKTVAIEKLAVDAGQTVSFNEVLLKKNENGSIEIGQPFVESGVVTATIVKHMRGPKLIVFKFKRRKKSRVKKGHRQAITIIRVNAF